MHNDYEIEKVPVAILPTWHHVAVRERWANATETNQPVRSLYGVQRRGNQF